LDVTHSILDKYLVPADYCKPKIEIRNYFLKWNVESYGVPQKEINELKKFITNAIPFFDTIYELLNSFEKAKYKDRYRLRQQLSPTLNISSVSKHTSHSIMIRYELHMHPDGSTFIDRIEGVQPIRAMRTTELDNYAELTEADIQKYQVRPIFYLKWTLGELLFNRQGKLASSGRA
jgi:hypothetical protein